MNKLSATLALTLVALCTGAIAQETDATRQQRMDAAYDAHHESTAARVADTTKRDARAAGHAIHQGVRATGHAVHHGVDKVTGHP